MVNSFKYKFTLGNCPFVAKVLYKNADHGK